MKLTLNGEFAKRHLFVTILMAALACWFGYDGFVRYPATDAAALYKSIEGSEPSAGQNLEAFKRQKTQTQYGFTVLALLAALAVGGHLWKVSRFVFEFDDEGFTFSGRRTRYGEIKTVDWRLWKKKGIVYVDGIKLDAWHHTGVKEFAALVEKACGAKEAARA